VRKCYMRTPGVHSKNDLENDRAGRSRGVESLRRSSARLVVSNPWALHRTAAGAPLQAPGDIGARCVPEPHHPLPPAAHRPDRAADRDRDRSRPEQPLVRRQDLPSAAQRDGDHRAPRVHRGLEGAESEGKQLGLTEKRSLGEEQQPRSVRRTDVTRPASATLRERWARSTVRWPTFRITVAINGVVTSSRLATKRTSSGRAADSATASM
jgi:hypothetical protein